MTVEKIGSLSRIPKVWRECVPGNCSSATCCADGLPAMNHLSLGASFCNPWVRMMEPAIGIREEKYDFGAQVSTPIGLIRATMAGTTVVTAPVDNRRLTASCSQARRQRGQERTPRSFVSAEVSIVNRPLLPLTRFPFDKLPAQKSRSSGRIVFPMSISSPPLYRTSALLS